MGYKKGQSGNPAGKKPGTRNKTTVALESFDGKTRGIPSQVDRRPPRGDRETDDPVLHLGIARMQDPI